MLNRHPLMFRFLIIVIFPACMVLAFLYSYFKSSLTPEVGTIVLDELDYPVEITHDTYGTPNIVAETDRDAYFSLGFKHASDRLWQLEVQRRFSQGRLSELFGAEALAGDITMRTLGLHEAAKQSLPFLQKDTLDALSAYAEGINAWVEQASRLPVEFQLFGIRPEPWTVVDSLSWQKTFALTLSGNMTDELNRSHLKKHLTAEQMRYIYPYDPTVPVEKTDPVSISFIFQNDGLVEFGVGHLFAGSNAWVVAGEYTQSGKPILANDPHLGLQLPSVWYAASMKGDKLNVSGMTLVGLPMVIFGQNTDIAWGGTNLQSDQQDLFIETTSLQEPNKYLDDGEWKTFESRREQINVSATFPAFLREKLNPVEIVVRSTERGPVISDMQADTNATISLRWSALDAEDHTVDAFYKLQYAGNWQEFRHSLAQLKSPGLNFLYADRKGNIGYQAAGMIPKRAEGVGIVPLVAKGNNWQGYYDFDLLPSIYNPERGFIVSANEKIDHPSKVVISHEWAPPARHDRIASILKQHIDSKRKLTAPDMQAIQGDTIDLTALALLPVLLEVNAETPQEREVVDVLTQWNGEFSRESVGAMLFATWSHYLMQEVFGDKLHGDWRRPAESALLLSSLERVDWAQLAKLITTDSKLWCQERQHAACAKELRNSLRSTLKQLEKISGTDSLSEWKLGDFSSTEFSHQPLGGIKGLEWLFKRRVTLTTSPNSVNAGNLKFDPLTGYTQTFGSTFRQVFELDSSNSHWYMVSTGQSGNVVSEHFDDMIMPFSQAQMARFDIKNQSEEVLKLIPR